MNRSFLRFVSETCQRRQGVAFERNVNDGLPVGAALGCVGARGAAIYMQSSVKVGFNANFL
jgi:hypothetical protein